MVTWDVTSLVQDWHGGVLANHGLIIKNDVEDASDDKRDHWFSSEEGNAPPSLVIEYASPLAGITRSNALSAYPTILENGDLVQVEMTLTAEGAISNVAPEAPVVKGTNGASAVRLLGPTPSGANVAPGKNLKAYISS